MADNVRYHSKHHARAHHTTPTVGYHDSGVDPLASSSSPYLGSFYVSGGNIYTYSMYMSSQDAGATWFDISTRMTSDDANEPNWNSTYSTVYGNSADWLSTGEAADGFSETFTGDGSEKRFESRYALTSGANVIVTIGGVVQTPVHFDNLSTGHYALSANAARSGEADLVFSTAPANTEPIELRHFNFLKGNDVVYNQSYNISNSALSAFYTRQTVVPTDGAYEVTLDASKPYIQGLVEVYLNGILLRDAVDYTANGGTTITMSQSSWSSDDLLDIIAPVHQTLFAIPSAVYTREQPALTNGSAAVTLTNPYTPGLIQVYLNGILLEDGLEYTATNGSSVTMSSTVWDADDELDVIAYTNVQLLSAATWSVNGNDIYTVNSGNVGIGTTAPAEALTVVGNVSAQGSVYSSDVANVKAYGATGDGTTDDTTAIQNAIDSASSLSAQAVFFPTGTYLVARSTGTNDRWGLKISSSNVTLLGARGAKLKRYNTDISTYALAYPILFVGVADNDSGAQVTNVTIDNIEFVGEDVQHSTSGSSLPDGRMAIQFKNTKRTTITNCIFSSIDSHAIWYQSPYQYDYANSAYYNTTKNYDTEITHCRFVADSHSTVGRAVMHTIDIGGVDHVRINNNYFEWCDNGVSGGTTYDDLDDVETDTWTPASFSAIKRVGRYVNVTGNVFYNSSEHSVYMTSMDAVVASNNFYTDEPTICNQDPVKIRARNCSVTGNTISNFRSCISINEPSFNVNVTGNVISSRGGTTGGVIDINADTIVAYIDARPYLDTYYSVGNLTVAGNSITFPALSSAPPAGGNLDEVAFRIYTPTSSNAAYPEYNMIDGVVFTGNTIQNYKYGVYVIGGNSRNIVVEGNVFGPKSFATSGFTTTTSMSTIAPIAVNQASTNALQDMTFNENKVRGAKALWAIIGGTGTSVALPYTITGNIFQYIQSLDAYEDGSSGGFRTIALDNHFTANNGTQFLDRTWATSSTQGNSLGTGGTSNSLKRSMIIYDSTDAKLYYDDVGGYHIIS